MRRHSRLALVAAAVFGFGIFAALAASPDRSPLRDRYFLVVWSYEGPAKLPHESHTFITVYDGNDLALGRVKPDTISWLPEDGDVRLLGSCQGRNFSLAQTLVIACQSGKRIKSLGPFEISADLYGRVLARIQYLESGNVKYSCSNLGRSAMNCVQAAGDLTDTRFRPGPVWGFVAGRAIVRHLKPFLEKGGRVNKEVARMILVRPCR
ncbi:MAG: hypothetical protein QNJ62_12030 [Methyloceanibacter sp.]|nr:hypothetical protein [Methyloceanibacter sp.]